MPIDKYTKINERLMLFKDIVKWNDKKQSNTNLTKKKQIKIQFTYVLYLYESFSRFRVGSKNYSLVTNCYIIIMT